jgi:hypothetical protein
MSVSNDSSTAHDPATPAADATPEDAERRAALERLGAMAAWTAPAVLTLLVSPRASAASLAGTTG